MLEKEQMEQLRQPFPPESIQWKPGATRKDGSKALGLPYVDSRHYQDRLDEIVGPDWTDDYEIHQDGGVILCRLTIAGITRSDVGEKNSGDKNTATSAKAQAFKRACTAFGLGRYLYEFPQMWAAYSSQYKRFSDEGKAQLIALAKRHSGSPGNAPAPEKSTNGHQYADKVDRAKAMMHAVNQKTNGYYNAVPHLLNAIQLEMGDEQWVWPELADEKAWGAAYKLAVAHTKKDAG